VAVTIAVSVTRVDVVGVAVVAALPHRRTGIAVVAAVPVVDDRVHAHHPRIVVIGFVAIAVRRAVVARGLCGCHAGGEQAEGQHGGGWTLHVGYSPTPDWRAGMLGRCG